jgi:hypothetical protein
VTVTKVGVAVGVEVDGLIDTEDEVVDAEDEVVDAEDEVIDAEAVFGDSATFVEVWGLDYCNVSIYPGTLSSGVHNTFESELHDSCSYCVPTHQSPLQPLRTPNTLLAGLLFSHLGAGAS